MREQVARLSAMVDDLFELSKIDAGALRLSLQDVALYDVISDAVADLRAISGQREIRIDGAKDDDLAVRADPRQLSRAVSNLLVNAVQHTPEGAPISVETMRVPNGACIAIVDAGGGIDPGEVERVFDAGWRGAPARTPPIAATASESLRSSGAGLGLAIVRGIAIAHGGTVTVQNVAGGCRFELTLPAAGQPAPRNSSSRAIGS